MVRQKDKHLCLFLTLLFLSGFEAHGKKNIKNFITVHKHGRNEIPVFVTVNIDDGILSSRPLSRPYSDIETLNDYHKRIVVYRVLSGEDKSCYLEHAEHLSLDEDVNHMKKVVKAGFIREIPRTLFISNRSLTESEIASVGSKHFRNFCNDLPIYELTVAASSEGSTIVRSKRSPHGHGRQQVPKQKFHGQVEAQVSPSLDGSPGPEAYAIASPNAAIAKVGGGSGYAHAKSHVRVESDYGRGKAVRTMTATSTFSSSGGSAPATAHGSYPQGDQQHAAHLQRGQTQPVRGQLPAWSSGSSHGSHVSSSRGTSQSGGTYHPGTQSGGTYHPGIQAGQVSRPVTQEQSGPQAATVHKTYRWKVRHPNGYNVAHWYTGPVGPDNNPAVVEGPVETAPLQLNFPGAGGDGRSVIAASASGGGDQSVIGVGISPSGSIADRAHAEAQSLLSAHTQSFSQQHAAPSYPVQQAYPLSQQPQQHASGHQTQQIQTVHQSAVSLQAPGHVPQEPHHGPSLQQVPQASYPVHHVQQEYQPPVQQQQSSSHTTSYAQQAVQSPAVIPQQVQQPQVVRQPETPVHQTLPASVQRPSYQPRHPGQQSHVSTAEAMAQHVVTQTERIPIQQPIYAAYPTYAQPVSQPEQRASQPGYHASVPAATHPVQQQVSQQTQLTASHIQESVSGQQYVPQVGYTQSKQQPPTHGLIPRPLPVPQPGQVVHDVRGPQVLQVVSGKVQNGAGRAPVLQPGQGIPELPGVSVPLGFRGRVVTPSSDVDTSAYEKSVVSSAGTLQQPVQGSQVQPQTQQHLSSGISQQQQVYIQQHHHYIQQPAAQQHLPSTVPAQQQQQYAQVPTDQQQVAGSAHQQQQHYVQQPVPQQQLISTVPVQQQHHYVQQPVAQQQATADILQQQQLHTQQQHHYVQQPAIQQMASGIPQQQQIYTQQQQYVPGPVAQQQPTGGVPQHQQVLTEQQHQYVQQPVPHQQQTLQQPQQIIHRPQTPQQQEYIPSPQEMMNALSSDYDTTGLSASVLQTPAPTPRRQVHKPRPQMPSQQAPRIPTPPKSSDSSQCEHEQTVTLQCKISYGPLQNNQLCLPQTICCVPC